jgi:mono/diheme cytochrome c family protein
METMRMAMKGPISIICTKATPRIDEVIIAGIKGEMPSFGKKLGDPDVRQLIAYLLTQHG